jgi:hypothetical protein
LNQFYTTEENMFRRFRNPVFQPNPLTPAQMQNLNQANRLTANGQPGQAAPLFADVAGQMEATHHPRRAANLHALAAHAYADSRNEQAALVQARAALTLFIENQMARRTPVFYTNITRKFTNNGMPNAAAALAKEFGSRVGGMPAPVTPVAGPHGRLPTNCGKCGAPIHTNEANWVDEGTVECDYCSSLIRAE